MIDNRSIFFEELFCQAEYENKPQYHKDILIIVKNQYEYIKKCIESIYKNTNNFDIYLWDNGSKPQTADYLQELTKNNNFHLIRKDDNHGFIIPNNRLAEIGKSPFIILLNSDTEVRKGWDTALIGYLLANPQVKQTAYMGCTLNEEGRGFPAWCGNFIDFLPGWCFCISREVYDQFGLFDEQNLTFAYGEDSDLSLRLMEGGFKIYALHLDLVIHHGNKTIAEVQFERDTALTFENNHRYLRQRWHTYLTSKRVLLKQPLTADSTAIP